MDTLRAPNQPRSRLTKLHEQHATPALLFATRLTGDPAVAAQLTDDSLIKLGARFADRRHPDSFGHDLRRTIVHMAGSRRARGPSSRNEVLARAAAILLADEGLSLDQVAAVLNRSTKRVGRLIEHGPIGLQDAGWPEQTTNSPRPSRSLLRRWRVARFRTLLMALLVVAGAGTGGWKTYAAATRSAAHPASQSGNAALRAQRAPVVSARIPLAGPGFQELFPYNGPGEMAAADGIVWVAGHYGVVGIDAASNEIVRVVSRSEGIGFGGGLAAGDGIVVVAEGNTAPIETPGGLVRIDPEAERITGSFALAGTTAPNGAAVGEGATWLAARNIGIYRIDPNSMEAVATVPLRHPRGVAVGFGSVWATTSWQGDDLIAQIDPAANAIVAQTPVPSPSDLAVGEAAVWVLSGGRICEAFPGKALPVGCPPDMPPSLVSIDPASGAVRWSKPLSATAIAAGAGAVWALDQEPTSGSVATLKKIDPSTGAVVAELDLGEIQAVDLCVLEGSVWVLDAQEPSIIRVDV